MASFILVTVKDGLKAYRVQCGYQNKIRLTSIFKPYLGDKPKSLSIRHNYIAQCM